MPISVTEILNFLLRGNAFVSLFLQLASQINNIALQSRRTYTLALQGFPQSAFSGFSMPFFLGPKLTPYASYQLLCVAMHPRVSIQCSISNAMEWLALIPHIRQEREVIP